MSTPERYIELVELAECSPDLRLTRRGVRVQISECRAAMDAFFDPNRKGRR